MTAEDFAPGVPYVALFRATSIVSRLIRWQTRGQWSHAAIVIDGMVYESREGRGVIKRRWGTNVVIDKGWRLRVPRAPTLDKPTVDAMRTWIEMQVGSAYDYRQVFRFVSRFGVHPSSLGKWFCSELVYQCFANAGLPLFTHTAAWEVSPAMLDRTPLLETVHTVRKESKS